MKIKLKEIWKKLTNQLTKYYPIIFTLIFVSISLQYSFSTLEAIFYDFRVRSDFGMKYNENIVVITLDEESEEFLGETFPYSYTTHNRFLTKLIADQPNSIIYFLNLAAPDTEIQIQDQNNLKRTIQAYQENKKSFFRFGTDMDAWGEQLPHENLRDLGYSLALFNVDNVQFARDDVTRRMILNISGDDSLHLVVANHFRDSRNEDLLQANKVWGSYYLREADATFALFRYYTSPLSDLHYINKIPFHRVVVGNFPKNFFKDKIVLVGSQYIANTSDYLLTPFNKEKHSSSKLNIHAAIIESLIQNKTVLQLPRIYTNILCLIIAIVLSITISSTKPTKGLLITVLTIIGVLALSYLAFSLFGVWIYITHLILTVFIVYYIWVPFRAIAEYQRRFAIQEETKLLKKVDNLKQNFISLMSHDLKTPVAKIAGLADLLSNQYPNTKEQKNHLISIVETTKELNKFITSILDLTKIESRNLDLQMQSKDINKLVIEVVENLKFEAETKGVELITELSPLYPIKLDMVLMQRVISNLVENAIKYSGERSKVMIKTWDDEKWVYLEVADNGAGISKKDLELIFDKFYRVKNDITLKVKGSGLGLYLVKYFIELHGGEINAESEINIGTKFLVKLKNS